MFFFLPILSARHAPIMTKVGLLGLLSVALVPIIVSTASLPTSLVGLTLAIFGEILVGALMGFASKLIFYAVDFGAELLAVQAALMRSKSFDPTTEEQGSVIGPLFMYLTVFAFCATGTHLEVLAAFVRSYDLVPAGLGAFGMGSIETIVKYSSGIFVIGLGMAAPLIAFAFVVNMLIAILGRVASKFNILVLSFAFRILGGILIIYFSVRLILGYILDALDGTGLRMLEFITR